MSRSERRTAARTPEAKDRPRIAVVGGGFTGAAAAIALLARVSGPFRLSVVEPRRALGEGVAYGEARRGDILNVRAEDMRLRWDQPRDFARWLADKGLLVDETLQTSFYAPRRIFGAYVGARFAAACAARPDVNVEHLPRVAAGIRPGQCAPYEVALEGGGAVEADVVIVATGYGLARAPRFGGGAYEGIPESVLLRAHTAAIVGAGLSAIDAALFLAQASAKLKIRMISRRGLRPLVQNAGPASTVAWTDAPPATALAALGAVRRRTRDAAAQSKDWRAVLNGLRPATQEIWRGLPEVEKRRFMRHAKPYWDVSRHRMPSSTATTIAQLECAGRLVFESGTVTAHHDGAIHFRPRGSSASLPIEDDIVIDCTGHCPDVTSPTIQSLFAAGFAAPDALGMGVAVLPSGRVLDGTGCQTPGIYALGPLGAGSLLEISAAPEIAEQAWSAAGEIAREIAAVTGAPV